MARSRARGPRGEGPRGDAAAVGYDRAQQVARFDALDVGLTGCSLIEDLMHARRDDDAFPGMLGGWIHGYAQRTFDLPRCGADAFEILERIGRRRYGHGEQEMFGAEVVMAGVAAFLFGQMDDRPSRWTET